MQRQQTTEGENRQKQTEHGHHSTLNTLNTRKSRLKKPFFFLAGVVEGEPRIAMEGLSLAEAWVRTLDY